MNRWVIFKDFIKNSAIFILIFFHKLSPPFKKISIYWGFYSMHHTLIAPWKERQKKQKRLLIASYYVLRTVESAWSLAEISINPTVCYLGDLDHVT